MGKSEDIWSSAVNGAPLNMPDPDDINRERKEETKYDKIGQAVTLGIFIGGFALEVHLVIVILLLRWLTPWL